MGVQVNLVQAAEYLKRAADQGHAKSQVNYGNCLRQGNGVKIDLRKAAGYYKLAADQNLPHGQLSYGCCLCHGEGVALNLPQGAGYYKLAADQNHALGQLVYGICLCRGEGVELNLAEGVRHFRLAADHSDNSDHDDALDKVVSSAQSFYGFALEYGVAVALDIERAFKYYEMAAFKYYEMTVVFAWNLGKALQKVFPVRPNTTNLLLVKVALAPKIILGLISNMDLVLRLMPLRLPPITECRLSNLTGLGNSIMPSVSTTESVSKLTWGRLQSTMNCRLSTGQFFPSETHIAAVGLKITRVSVGINFQSFGWCHLRFSTSVIPLGRSNPRI
jgi:hypothetical protein